MEGVLTAAEWEALGLSLRVALVAVLATLPFAFLAALLLARRQFRGKALVDGLIHLPLVLPPVALGYLLLISLGTQAPLGAWLLDTFGIRFVFSWTGAALASAILTFPFQVRAIRLSLEAQDRGLAEAAETLGAGPLDRLFSLYLPLAIARHPRRRGHRVCRLSRRVRRHHHLRLQHPRRDAHDPARDLHRDPEPRRRGCRRTLGGALDYARARRPRSRRRARAPCSRRARLMGDHVELRHTLGAFRLDAAFEFGDRAGVTALFGPSGSGKSTVINAIAGLIRPEFGRVVLGGETLLDTDRGVCVPAHARRVGVVFQDTRLFPHLTVKANLLYGWQRASAKADTRGIDAVIALLALDQLLDRRPRTLSGGEKSRVALGRALLMNPRALLLDEPLAALDAARKAEILPYLDRLVRETKIPMLYVSHSLDEVARLADRMVLIDKGRVIAQGSLFEVTQRLDLIAGNELLPGAVLEARVAGHDEPHGLTELILVG